MPPKSMPVLFFWAVLFLLTGYSLTQLRQFYLRLSRDHPLRFYVFGIYNRYASSLAERGNHPIRWLDNIVEGANESSSSFTSSSSSSSSSKRQSKPRRSNKPNIVLIVVDDLGFNDLNRVDTTNIRSIYQSGVLFEKAYSGQATCAPSRAAIVTGRNPTRFGFEFTPIPLLMADVLSHPTTRGRKRTETIEEENNSKGGHNHSPIAHRADYANIPAMADMMIPTSEVLISEVLKEFGYRNYLLGKWHLGQKADGATPLDRSYHESLSFLPGASMYLPEDHADVVNARLNNTLDEFLWANLPFTVQHNNGKHLVPDLYMTDYLSREAEALLRAHVQYYDKKEGEGEEEGEEGGRVPFFLHLNYNAPHNPLQALRSDYDSLEDHNSTSHTERVYAAMIKSLDRGVGKVIQALKDVGRYDNTLLIFTSDNGGAGYIGVDDVNLPFRGFKCTFFEGGVRVPLFMQWPDMIEAGQVDGATRVSHVDIFATIAKAAETGDVDTDVDTDADVDTIPYVSYASYTSSVAVNIPQTNDTTPNFDHFFYFNYITYNNGTSFACYREYKDAILDIEIGIEGVGIGIGCGDLRSQDFCSRTKRLLKERIIDGANLFEGLKSNRSSTSGKSTLKNINPESFSSSQAPLLPLNGLHDHLFWRSGHYRSIIKDDWKLQVSFLPLKAWLFDLLIDPLESTNLLGGEEWFLSLMKSSNLRPELFSLRSYGQSDIIQQDIRSKTKVALRKIIKAVLFPTKSTTVCDKGSKVGAVNEIPGTFAAVTSSSNHICVDGIDLNDGKIGLDESFLAHMHNSTLPAVSIRRLHDLWSTLLLTDAEQADPLWPAAIEYSIQIDKKRVHDPHADTSSGDDDGSSTPEYVYWSN